MIILALRARAPTHPLTHKEEGGRGEGEWEGGRDYLHIDIVMFEKVQTHNSQNI